MKKIFVFVLAAMSFALVSCTSVEGKAKDYCEQMIKAGKSNDNEKFKELNTEFENWFGSLSEEDQEKARQVMLEYLGEIIRTDFSGGSNGLFN